MMWAVLKIGCIECEVESGIVGTFTAEGDAENIADELTALQNGSHVQFIVCQLPTPDIGIHISQWIEP
jgi:hypothetical protein